ncbi:MAG TPA: carboxymuconolactone decarboxylase family protein [Rhizomicrobium sp.]|nr:carboxymuconolactone decarboxylase family protein [Rhizomicrobium sp.]
MPLIPFADLDTAPEDVREVFEKLPRKLNIFRMWANASTLFKPGMRFGGAILSRQKLDPALRELVILLVAKLEGGEYEWVQHVPIGLAVGCRQEQIAALEAGRFDDASFDAREKVLLRFSKEVIEDVRASENAVEEAAAHFSPQEIVEIILTCGFYMTMARLTETTRTDIDPPSGTAITDNLKRMRER